jgi:cation diffusion facilitator CzcD-associated flavoprotein CzcO
MNKEASFCVVGAGMSGLLMCIRLKQAGYKNIRLLEKASDLGGTWYHNRYPGVACDVPAPYYSYSFALNPVWSQKFAPGDEIHQYFKQVAKDFDLNTYIEFNTEVLSAEFDGAQWQVSTSKDESLKVDFLISACGILHKAVYPNIEGIDSFKGAMFHSSAWDKNYSLEGKRVAVIGNGSTGVQMIPRLAEQAACVVSFQRSAQWIMPAKNKFYSEAFKKAQRFIPGLKQFQYWSNRKTFESFTNLVLEDGWQRRLVDKLTKATLNTVKDEELKQKLTPDYEPGCKRLVMSNEYYRAMQKDKVRLCTDGIERITEKGIETKAGEHIEFDLIVLATGFDPRAYMRPMTLTNEKGLSLDQVWQSEGIKAYRTVMLPDFANFFMVLGPNSPVGNFSVIAAAEDQTRFIIKLIQKKLKRDGKAVRVKKEATEDYNEQIKAAMKETIWLTGCSSWYLDEQGNSATWPWTPKKFREDLKQPDFEHFCFD